MIRSASSGILEIAVLITSIGRSAAFTFFFNAAADIAEDPIPASHATTIFLIFLISTPATSLVLSAPEKGELKYIYYGAKLSDRDFQTIGSLDKGKYAAYPVYGLNCPSEVALAVKHNDGNMTLQLEVVKVESSHQDEANLTIISLKDKVYPFYVKMFYKAYQDTDIIEIWSEISHQEKKTVVLNQFASAYLPIRKGDVWLSHLYGAWANEGRLEEVPLEAGMKVIQK